MFDINLILIGLGGTGSFLAEPLIRLLTYHSAVERFTSTFVDGGEYEERNHERQLFPASANGKNKALYHAEQLDFLVTIKTLQQYLTKPQLKRRLKPTKLNLVISCVDNDATRKANLEVLTDSGLDFIFITPGNELTYGQAQACGKIGASILGIDPRTYNKGVATPNDVAPIEGGCMLKAESSPQLIGANFMAAASAFLILENFLDGEGFAHQVQFDIRQFKMSL